MTFTSDHVQVFIDFDGTITRADVLDEMIRGYAVDESWQAVEGLWASGLIGSHECLRREFDLIRILPDTLDDFLSRIPIDPGAAELFALLAQRDVPVAILSDGIQGFILRILRRNGIKAPRVFANDIRHEEDRLSLVCPHRSATCLSASAHCKCASAAAMALPQRRVIYIGDGRSDLCVARKADVRYAKGTLATLLAAEGLEFRRFETLLDVAAELREMMGETKVPLKVTLKVTGKAAAVRR